MKKPIPPFLIHDVELLSYDPYDIWTTTCGVWAKKMFNNIGKLAAIPVALLLTVDVINDSMRIGYTKRKYPVVLAFAVLILIEAYKKSKNESFIKIIEHHLDWLYNNPSTGYTGKGWGVPFINTVSSTLTYPSGTPYTTNTPYVLEAFYAYSEIFDVEARYPNIFKDIESFYTKHIQIMYEDDDSIATSYGPLIDRIVTNSVSYTLYALTLLKYKCLHSQSSISDVYLDKLYSFICKQQRADGSWLYAPFDDNSFIDCFHSCFVLKNLYKTHQIRPLKSHEEIITKGYDYLKSHFLDADKMLFRRFSLSNKPSLTKFDLYDNAEMLQLSALLGDEEITLKLKQAIEQYFVKDNVVYSKIASWGMLQNPNTLRWAVMPYLYSLSIANKLVVHDS